MRRGVCLCVCVGRGKLISLFNNLVREVCLPGVTIFFFFFASFFCALHAYWYASE
jgi:hypothetical protein